MFFREHSENLALGSVGIAVIVTNAEYRVILYRSKQDVLSTFSLSTSSEKVIYVKNDYVQYHDDVTHFWSIRFTTNTDRDEFLAAVKTRCSIEKETVEKLAENEQPKCFEVKNNIAEPLLPNSQSTLIDRMAKMGQQILPSGVFPSKEVSSDSEDHESYPSQPQRNTIVASKWKPDVPSRSMKYPTSKTPPVLSANTLISYNPTVHSMTSDTEMVSLFTENRFQNTEVRMCLSKLESKIERVLDKVDLIREANSTSSNKPKSDLEEEIIKLEEKLLNLKKENRQLRLDQMDKVSLDEQKKNSQLEEQLESQKAEIEGLRSSIAVKDSEIKNNNSLRLRSDEKFKLHISELGTKIDELTNNKLQSASEISKLKSTIDELKIDNQKLDEQLAQLQLKSESSGGIKISAVVKDIMNTLYQNIHETVSHRTDWSTDEVLKLMRTAIKRETMTILGAHPSS